MKRLESSCFFVRLLELICILYTKYGEIWYNEFYIRKRFFGGVGMEENKMNEEAIFKERFPQAVITGQSALYFYGYTDTKPERWQIAVDEKDDRDLYKIEELMIEPDFQSKRILTLGLVSMKIDQARLRIFDRERTICEIVKAEGRLEEAVVETAIRRYVQDPKMDLQNLFEYAEVLGITQPVQKRIRKWK